MPPPLPASIFAQVGIVVAISLGACATGGGQHPVERVTLHGNKAFHDGDIVDRLATRPPHGWPIRQREELDPVALDVDADRIETFYHEHGYFDAKVTNVKVTTASGGAAQVDIDVDEGEVTKLAGITFEGADEKAALAAIAQADLDLRLDRPYESPTYELAKVALVKAFQKKGYAYAKVTGVVEVDRVLHRATVRFSLDLGPICRFGKVTVKGQQRIQEETILNRVAWKEGQVYDPDLVERTEGRLFTLGVFSSVHVSYPRLSDNPVLALTIHVSESTTHEVRLGFGGALDVTHFEAHVRGGYTIHGLFGDPLLSFRTDVTPGWSWLRSEPFTSGPSIDTVAALDRDDLFVPNLHGELLAAFDRQPHIGYILTGPRTSVGVTYPLAYDLKLAVGWQLQYLIFDSFDPTVFGPEATSSWLGYYSQQLVLDERDRPLDAHRGYYAAVELLEGGPEAGGAVLFFRITPDVRGYVPIGHRLVLATRVRYGRLFTGGTNDAPVPVRYLGGGANDDRGFGFQRLSPQLRDSSGNLIPVGGSEEFLGTFEIRLEVFTISKQWFSVVTFCDAGDVTGRGGLDLGNLNYAVGVGIRYDTLIGPVRADVGFRLNRTDAAGADGLANPDPGSWWAFQLSLGEAF